MTTLIKKNSAHADKKTNSFYRDYILKTPKINRAIPTGSQGRLRNYNVAKKKSREC